MGCFLFRLQVLMTVGTSILNTIIILLWSFVQPWDYHLLRAAFHELLTFSLNLVNEQWTVSKTAGSLWSRNTVAHAPSYLQTLQKRRLYPETWRKSKPDNFSSSSFGTLKVQVHKFIWGQMPLGECFHWLHWSLDKNQPTISECK